jgi:predicted metal-binding membrane protein
MVALGALMLAEKAVPGGARLARASGITLLGIAAALLVTALA